MGNSGCVGYNIHAGDLLVVLFVAKGELRPWVSVIAKIGKLWSRPSSKSERHREDKVGLAEARE